ncbi:long-chain-fatty-acid--CoA ligase 1-like [Corticium candelabrum]|uniref:long-chain-fatty-acid--CoA ligase 1-like n=1 Tax=Corticium candelabrum TaxID=121492 RepID=UPI002E26408F|nr:long-chain-fatty-acid--CoA ligase 1-like [Corticium candelabrum]
MALSWLWSSPQPTFCVPADMMQRQSRELPGGERIHISSLCESDELVSSVEGASSLYAIFQRGLRLAGDGNCLGWIPSPNEDFHWLSYKRVNERATQFGSGLIKKFGCTTDSKSFIGIFMQNKPEWVITEQAVNAYSMVLVPLYDTLGPSAVSYIINQAEISLIVCDSNKVDILIEQKQNCSNLKVIIKVGDVTIEDTEKAESAGVEIVSFLDVETAGVEDQHDHVPPKPSSLATVCYTSGTTGDPKGVMLTHQNFAAVIGASLQNTQAMSIEFTPTDVHFSYLPLAHSFERIIQAMFLSNGGQIGFFQGDRLLILDDLKKLRPTFFPAVPRILNRVYDKVMAGVSASVVKKHLFNFAMWLKKKELERGIITNNSWADILVFRKIQDRFGGRLRCVITGSAPVSDTVLRFFRSALGCPVLEGYGQTENCAGACVTLPCDPEPGNVGPPLTCNYIKLVDVPDLEYFSANDQGEVCLKGPNVFIGYLHNEEKTRDALDKDNWLHTGDVGEWLPNGTLKIIDRAKHIFKLSQGEYVAPEKVEQVYSLSPLVAQVFVYGDSLKDFPVGVVVPDEPAFLSWAEQRGWKGSMDELCENEDLNKEFLKALVSVGKEMELRGFEQMKAVHLHHDLFSIENDLITPTLKNKRPQLKKRFSEELDAMYAKLAS